MTHNSSDLPLSTPSEHALPPPSPFKLSRARQFVHRYGTALDIALLDLPPDPVLLHLLRPYQNADGSWMPGTDPAYRQFDTEISASAPALHLLIALGLGRTSMCHRTLLYVDAAQRPNGSWENHPAITAMIADALQQIDPAAQAATITRAKNWLRLHDDRLASVPVTPACWHSLALFGAPDHGARPEDARITAECRAALLASDDLNVFEQSAILQACAIAGLSSRDALVSLITSMLSQAQQPDGGWAARIDSLRPRSTVVAIRALSLWSGVDRS